MTTATKPPCIDGTQAHHWQIPPARGLKEDVAVCKRCKAKKIVPISYVYDWADNGRLRQKTTVPLGVEHDGPPATVLPKYGAQQEIRLPGSRERRTV